MCIGSVDFYHFIPLLVVLTLAEHIVVKRVKVESFGFISCTLLIIIIIAFKGAIRDFLHSPHSAVNCLQHIRSSGPGATNHVQHIERLSRASVMLRATWYEGTAQLLSLTELKSHLFELYFIGWTIKLMKKGRKPEYLEKTPGDELQKMPHTTAHRFKNPCSSIGGRLGKQTC